MRKLLVILLILKVFQSCVWDPIYSLHFINKSEKQIIFRIQERRPDFLLNFKLANFESPKRIESDSSFLKHYTLNDTLYTEIILSPNECVPICGGVGNYPRHIENDKFEIIVEQDTLILNGEYIVSNIIEYGKRQFVYEFKMK